MGSEDNLAKLMICAYVCCCIYCIIGLPIYSVQLNEINSYNNSISKELCEIVKIEYEESCCFACPGLKFKYLAIAQDKCGLYRDLIFHDYIDECLNDNIDEYEYLLNQTVTCYVPECDSNIWAFNSDDLEKSNSTQAAGVGICGGILACFCLCGLIVGVVASIK